MRNQASTMFFNDSVYGTFTIGEPTLQELIASQPLQRLQDISMAGYAEPFFPDSYHSRFEHSVGVCYLLSKFGASLKEQIAGLTLEQLGLLKQTVAENLTEDGLMDWLKQQSRNEKGE